MANDNPSDEIISLEDLVHGDSAAKGGASIAGAPVPESPSKNADPQPTDSSKPSDAGLSEIDNLLAVEDPAFSQMLDEIKASAPEPGESVEIESLSLEEMIGGIEVRQSARPDAGLIARWKNIIRHPLQALADASWGAITRAWRAKGAVLAFARESAKRLLTLGMGGFRAFLALPGKSKLMAMAVVVLGTALFAVVKVTFKGRFLPEFETGVLLSFADVADHAYVYDRNEPMEDFNSPLLHPDNVVLLEKMIVNLRSVKEGAHPMGLFEFYVETATREGAVEVKDREIEARDVFSRTLEQMPYEELVTAEGKHKLKLILRKNLNEVLTKGRVRKVFFKTIVLKP